MHSFTDSELRILSDSLGAMVVEADHHRRAATRHYEAEGEDSREIFRYMQRGAALRKLRDMVDSELEAR